MVVTNELTYIETPIENSADLEAYFIELTSAGAPWFDEA